MSPYSQALAHARLDALDALVQALKDAETPDEKRRCAVAIFNAPDPFDLDDTVEWTDADGTGNSESATGSPAALSGQPVPSCTTTIAPPAQHSPSPRSARNADEPRLPAAQPLGSRTGHPAASIRQPSPLPFSRPHSPESLSLRTKLPSNPLDLLNTLDLPPPTPLSRPHALLTRAGTMH